MSINLSLTKQAFRQPFYQKIAKKVDEHYKIIVEVILSSPFYRKVTNG